MGLFSTLDLDLYIVVFSLSAAEPQRSLHLRRQKPAPEKNSGFSVSGGL
jgi:hypothetical protein